MAVRKRLAEEVTCLWSSQKDQCEDHRGEDADRQSFVERHHVVKAAMGSAGQHRLARASQACILVKLAVDLETAHVRLIVHK